MRARVTALAPPTQGLVCRELTSRGGGGVGAVLPPRPWRTRDTLGEALLQVWRPKAHTAVSQVNPVLGKFRLKKVEPACELEFFFLQSSFGYCVKMQILHLG